MVLVAFLKIRKTRTFTYESKKKLETLESFQKGASAKGKNKESEIFSEFWNFNWKPQKLFKNYILGEKKKNFTSIVTFENSIKEIQDQLQQIEDENDLVLFSKFNVLINENLRNEPSAFIYEKVGTISAYFSMNFEIHQFCNGWISSASRPQYPLPKILVLR